MYVSMYVYMYIRVFDKQNSTCLKKYVDNNLNDVILMDNIQTVKMDSITYKRAPCHNSKCTLIITIDNSQNVCLLIYRNILTT